MKSDWFRENKIQLLIILILILYLIASWILYGLFGHQVIKAMYEGRSSGFLNKIVENRYSAPLESYFRLADRLLLRFSAALALIVGYVLFLKRFGKIIIHPILFYILTYLFISLYAFNINLLIFPTSTNYISAAEHVLEGKGFYSTGHDMAVQNEFMRTGMMIKPRSFHPYTYWPPLYPLLLVISMQALNVNPLSAAIIVNRIFYALLITLIYLILIQAAPEKLRSIIPVIAISLTFFKPFNFIFSVVWAEMAYIGLSILAIFLLHKFYTCAEEKELIILIFCAIFASLPVLCRYIGITVIITGLIVILLKNGLAITKKKLRNCFIFGSISSFPIFPWLVRNKMLTGFFGGRNAAPGSGDVFNELCLTIKVIAKDFLFTDNKYIVGFISVCALSFIIYKRKLLFPLLKPWIKKYIAFILYPFIYLTTLIALTSIIYLDPIYVRLTVPSYPFIIIGVVLLFYQFFNTIPDKN